MFDLPPQKPREIFRKVALDRLSSPDRLDLLTEVVSPKGWLVLVAIVFSVLVACVWGVFGRIPSKVAGQGILTLATGVFDVTSTAQGRVSKLLVEVGDEVAANQVVANIEQPELSYELATLSTRREQLLARKVQLEAYSQQGAVLSGELLGATRKQMQDKMRVLAEQVATLDERIQTDRALLSSGLITRQTLLDSQLLQEQVRQELESTRSQLQQLSLQNLESKKQAEIERGNVALELSNLEGQLGGLRERLELQSVVRSPYAGRILEIKAGKAGSLVGLGASLLTLERKPDQDGPLEAVIFVSAFDGPSVKVGMRVQISPGNVKPEEYGYMLGKVRWVSSYPASDQGIMQLLQNEKLVQTLGGRGPPIKLIADLIPDPSTRSGYAWSSKKGPDFAARSGTLAIATVTTETRRPIALVIPALRKLLGV